MYSFFWSCIIFCSVIGFFIGLFYLLKAAFKPWNDLMESMFDVNKGFLILDITFKVEEIKKIIKKLDKDEDFEYIKHYENLIISYKDRIKQLKNYESKLEKRKG